MRFFTNCILSISLIWLPFLPPEAHGDESKIDFNTDIRPILSNRCFTCHGPDEGTVEGGLRLDSLEHATQLPDSGAPAITPGDVSNSELLRRVTSSDSSERMPPEDLGEALSPEEIDKLKAWIEQGARYAKHWAFDAITPPKLEWKPIEDPRFEAWNHSPIDRFLYDKLLSKGWSPSPRADKGVLLRRIALDLTGIPPTWEEMESFLEDDSPDALERRVDALLASPAYGEHWGRKWLDLARYADSAGYADDPPRTIWKYRDWVVQAINRGMPFDQFTTEQIAGDLLTNPTEEQLIATAFHRNTLTNNEGGTNDEEFRNVAIVDRVNTTFSVWMGVTMACAQCHTHKYDPITQKEYFEVFAIFNQSQDADRKDESPTLEQYAPNSIKKRKQLQKEVAMRAALLKRFPSEPEDAAEREAVQGIREEKLQLEGKLKAIKPTTTVPIMTELPPEKHRKTFVQLRGNYRVHGEEVESSLPSAFHKASFDLNKKMSRMDLAKWLVQEDNPLTPRVVANRYWEQLFGTGIVRTSEEFGSQGDLPTHPELLDFLASELVRLRWDTKGFLRQILLSEAYLQSSGMTAETFERDPDNVFVSRGPRVRAAAEVIRDSALAASGLLSREMYGPPVRPPQPALGLRAAFGGKTDWETSKGGDRYRRALYTQWRRSNPYPSMATFDAPNREVCIVKRDRTNTPLQALVTLNDPAFVEAAQALARRVVLYENGGDEQTAQLERMFHHALGRAPRKDEVQALMNLFQSSVEELSNEPKDALKLATDPIGPLPKGASAVELAAWTTVCNVLFNLDEFLMKP